MKWKQNLKVFFFKKRQITFNQKDILKNWNQLLKIFPSKNKNHSMYRNFPNEFQKIFKEEMLKHSINASREENSFLKNLTNQFHESNKLQFQITVTVQNRGISPATTHTIHTHTHLRKLNLAKYQNRLFIPICKVSLT